MLEKIAETILDRDGNVMRVTNSLATFDPNTGSEHGQMNFAVQFSSPEWAVSKIDELTTVVSDAVNYVINDRGDIVIIPRPESHPSDPAEDRKPVRVVPPRAKCTVRVIPFQRERIFVSTVFSHGRSKDFHRILKQVATRHGLETRYAEQYTQSIRLNIHEEISKCMYFLQIITPRLDDRARMQIDPHFVPDFSWLTYEHGCAVALQHANPSRRCIQMLDGLLSDAVRKRVQHTQGDIAPIIFRIDDDEKTLKRHFRNAIRALTGDR
jgi:hypothetical protein